MHLYYLMNWWVVQFTRKNPTNWLVFLQQPQGNPAPYYGGAPAGQHPNQYGYQGGYAGNYGQPGPNWTLNGEWSFSTLSQKWLFSRSDLQSCRSFWPLIVIVPLVNGFRFVSIYRSKLLPRCFRSLKASVCNCCVT